MTGRDAGGPPQGRGEPSADVVTLSPRLRALPAILLVGLAIRLIIAYAVPNSGFENDLASFRGWAGDLARSGPWGFYERAGFLDYTPGYLYVLWLIGLAAPVLGAIGAAVPVLHTLLPAVFPTAGEIGDLIKLPPILADLALAWLVHGMVRELGAGPRRALLAALIVVVNPIIWFDSVVWGQADSFGVVFLLLGIRELWRDRTERAAIFTVVAAVIKPQLGILVPIVAAVTIRRALMPDRGHGADSEPPADAPPTDHAAASWEQRFRGPARILSTGIAGFLTAAILALPFFGLATWKLIEQVGKAAGGYPYATVNAYNPWALATMDERGLAANGQWLCDVVVAERECTEALMVGPVPAVVVGSALLLAIIIVTSLAVARRPDRLTILVGVAVLALAFFVVPTRVHERYLFPLFPLAAILAVVSWRWAVAYVLIAAATFANMYAILTNPFYATDVVQDWLGIAEALRSTLLVTIAALVHLGGLAWAGWQLTDGAVRRLRDEADIAVLDDRESSTGVPGLGVGGDSGTPALGPPGATLPATERGLVPWPSFSRRPSGRRQPETDEPVMPTWTPRPSMQEAGLWGWFTSRVLDRPVRADHSAKLEREGGGRLDRLDLWIVVVLVFAVLSLRMWRLAEPYQMHFDEVYHARTGTEFLQHWRYGISHDIYEWTHPHLAKYAMAGGVVAWGDDRVSATSSIGANVRAAARERRYGDPGRPEVRNGDRLWVATGAELRAYDLRAREPALTPIGSPGATALAVDDSDHVLYVGGEDGTIRSLDLAQVDIAVGGAPDLMPELVDVGGVGAAIDLVHITDDGQSLLVATTAGEVVMLDAVTGEETGRAVLSDVAALSDAGRGPVLVATPSEVEDPVAAASTIAEILETDAAELEALLAGDAERVNLAAVPASGEPRTELDTAIDDGRLPGLQVESLSRVAVAGSSGVTFLTPTTGSTSSTVELEGGAAGLADVTEIDDPKLYVTTNPPDGPKVVIITYGGTGAASGPTVWKTIPMPGPGSEVFFNEPTQQVHVLGRTQDGTASTVYVIEPHGNAVYADARLPFDPAATVLDADPLYPTDDRQQVLAFAADGSVASVETGKHAFAWRLPGVIAGVIMAALLYLLARILFRRREVAVFVGILALLDGMFFVQSRIAMNDSYVAVLIVGAYTIFAALWTGWARARSAFWVGMPAIGLLLGLALSAKWVAAYAIGALGILILARSALGRVILIAGMVVATTILGYMAISVPAGSPEGGNLTFMLIMIALTLVAAIVAVLHPIAWTHEELRFALGAPIAAGAGVFLLAAASGRLDTEISVSSVAISPLMIALALGVVSVAAYGAFIVAGRWGFGPLADRPDPDDPQLLLEPPAPAPVGWLRPGWAFGIPVVWVFASLLVIPLVVYVASYIPWAWIENHQLFPGWPEGHTGQTLLSVTEGMYAYHNNLSSPHAASSPWWAWPFDFKPVWFYQEGFAGSSAGAIYDAGNLVIWWLGIPALAFVAWQAFRRRSLALALIAIAFACQWIAWARIDRAAFQYHYYTSLPFVVLALAYFLAELWHGASRRTWLMARIAAGIAILGPTTLWLFHRPLCGFVGVDRTAENPPSAACPTYIQEFVLSPRSAVFAIVVGAAAIVLVWLLTRLGDESAGPRFLRGLPRVAQVLVVGVVAAIAMALGGLIPEDGSALIRLTNFPVEPIALVLSVPIAAFAAFVATARDARRFVAGAFTAAAAMFIIWYPNLSGLPMPSQIVNTFQGLLPTYLYPFQFPVSQVDRGGAVPSLASFETVLLLGALTIAVLVIGYATWVWRVVLAERAVAAREAEDGGDEGSLAPSGGRA